MSLRKRSYLIEASQKLSKNTEIYDTYGLCFSKWDGHLALVHLVESGFDAKTMTREYQVRFATDFNGDKFKANIKFLGLEPSVSNRNLPYEKITFTMGNLVYGRGIKGKFSKLYTYRVKVGLKDLVRDEKLAMLKFFEKNKIYDVSYEASKYKIKKSEWKSILNMSYSDIYNKKSSNTVNAVDDFLNHILKTDQYNGDTVWKNIRGVYSMNRDGKIKMVVMK